MAETRQIIKDARSTGWPVAAKAIPEIAAEVIKKWPTSVEMRISSALYFFWHSFFKSSTCTQLFLESSGIDIGSSLFVYNLHSSR